VDFTSRGRRELVGAPVFTTRGEANNAADLDPVPAPAVQGRLWSGVPELGRIAAILHSPQGLGFLILLICAVVAESPGKRPEPQADEAAETPAPAGAVPADLDRTEAIAVRPGHLPPVPAPRARAFHR
jgi:signal peptidase I